MNKTLEKTIDKNKVRKGIIQFEEKLKEMPGALNGHDTETLMPLKHTFVDGAYVREIFMPKGTLLTSKIHKIEHPYFVMKGKCSVFTETGVQKIEAPFHGITKPGTKRILYIHEDTTWITVHVTKETDLEKIEEQIIAKSFNDISLTHEDLKKLKEESC